ncbi:MAG: aldo/keto reductase [Kiritimatiellales bacterium]|nr:aldo/keto reductase [Kiritimatiellales bacterium]
MPRMNQREFLATMTGAAITAPLLARAAKKTDVPPPPMVTLGSTGIKTSRMAQGTGMRGGKRQSNHTRAGFEHFVGLLRHAYDRGIRFFDLADQYGTHIYFREALRYIPREEVTVLTKFQWAFDNLKNSAKLSPAQQRHSITKAIDRFRQEIGVDVIDILLMHNVQSATWDSELAGYIEVMREYKEKGIIRALGMSCHTLVALERAAELDWVEVALTRINPYGKIMDGKPEVVIPVQQRFDKRGAAVVGMKIYGAGRLTDKLDECMQFAQNLGYLDAMTIGAETPEQIDQNLRLMAKYPAV